ncbi:MAG: hypothetical protein LBU23_08905 [Planctomycetota bacterium]|jgi:hypothetical protein|nr:hypothetical protein [Planctomycetota bacterium]
MAKNSKQPAAPAEEPEVPAFPDMDSHDRKNIPDPPLTPEPPAAGTVPYRCVRKCLLQGELIRPGEVRHFPPGQAPGHFLPLEAAED